MYYIRGPCDTYRPLVILPPSIRDFVDVLISVMLSRKCFLNRPSSHSRDWTGTRQLANEAIRGEYYFIQSPFEDSRISLYCKLGTVQSAENTKIDGLFPVPRELTINMCYGGVRRHKAWPTI